MSVYTVHIPVQGETALQRTAQARLIKDGFSFMALVLGPVWMLWNRLWRESFIWFVVILAISAVLVPLNQPQAVSGVLSLLISFYIGLEANDWLRAELERQGFPCVEVVSANNEGEAEQAFFARWLASPMPEQAALTKLPSNPSTAQQGEPVGGLFDQRGPSW